MDKTEYVGKEMIKEMEFYERLVNAQNELHAPKNQFNDFSQFNYRSAEDILEAVKPINLKYNLYLTIIDDIEVHADRVYVKATAKIIDIHDEKNEVIVTAYARESASKKGMDESQITGSASSYARKYALNGMYLIDDNKDVDTNEHLEEAQRAEAEMYAGYEKELKEFQKFLIEQGEDIKALEQWIAEKEKKADYSSVSFERRYGRFKQLVAMKNESIREAEAKEKEEPVDLPDSPIDWGN